MAFRINGWLKLISFITILLILASCGAGKTAIPNKKASTAIEDDIIQYGRKYLGKPYRYAGKGPNSFDCSGYTSFVFRKFGYKLDSSSAGQDNQMPTIAKREELRKGDLVFFEGNRKNGNVGHVGIVTEVFSNGRFKFIHSSTTSGVIISSSTEPYYASRYLRGGRVLEKNASYVTRQKPTKNKQKASFNQTAQKKEPTTPSIPQVTPSETTFNSVDDNPQSFHASPSSSQKKSKEKEKPQPLHSEMVFREEEQITSTQVSKSHKVQMGETLYSISRLYGCTVEQLRTWNPQLSAVLKAGESLRVYSQTPTED